MDLFARAVQKTRVFIRWAAIVAGRTVRFVTHVIWYIDMDDIDRWKARLVRDLQTVVLMLRTFSDQKIGFQVTALAYRSMLSVVPFLAIAFYLKWGLGGLTGDTFGFLTECGDVIVLFLAAWLL